MHFELDEKFKERAKIKVVGVGGAGGNAINRMVEAGYEGVEFIAINTDALALDNSKAHHHIAIGKNVSRGLGAGAKPEVGYEAIMENRKDVEEALRGADLVFITAGMGGGTGTGAAPVVAQICQEKGILSVGVVSKPFSFEGPVRSRYSLQGIVELQKYVDTMVVIENTKILKLIDKKASAKAAFHFADSVLVNAVKGVSDIILRYGEVQIDFADLSTILRNGGDALMCTGISEGENRALEAAEASIRSPLLDESISICGAGKIMVNFTSGADIGMLEIAEAMDYIREVAGQSEDTNIIFGTACDPELGEKLSVTVIATNFNQYDRGDDGIETIDMSRQTAHENTHTSYSHDHSVAKTNIASRTQTQPNPFVAEKVNFQQPSGRVTNRMQVNSFEPVASTKTFAPIEEEVLQPHHTTHGMSQLAPQPVSQSRASSVADQWSNAHQNEWQNQVAAAHQAPQSLGHWFDQAQPEVAFEARTESHRPFGVATNRNESLSQHQHVEAHNYESPAVQRQQAQYDIEKEEDLDYPAFLRNQDL